LADDLAIRTEDLTKVYVDFWGREKVLALDKLNLEVKRGEIFGLLGPNGSGKTTTIKLLLGLIFPTAGRAWVLGRSPGDVKANERIGFLPEESYLYRFLNAEETLDFYGQLFRLSRKVRRERTRKLIEAVGLGHAGNRVLREYSRGMSRRIGLAQALINDPELVFLDEPTSGLDPIGTREIKDLIIDLRRQGKTVLLSSHLLADVSDMCDRIAILNNGRLEVVGEVDDLLSLKEMVDIRVKQPNPEALEKAKAALNQDGGAVVSMGHPTSTLEELFLKTIKGGAHGRPRQ
jgi:ABC-2 type transport system ATP-binding protein